MNNYCFSVVYGNHFDKFYITGKTLSSALKSLESEIFLICFDFPVLVDWHVCPVYTIVSSSGVESCRRLRKLVKGLA